MHRRAGLLIVSSALAATAAACGDDLRRPPECEHEVTPPERYRLFAVGHKVTRDEVVSYATYDASIRATVDAHVAPDLATDRTNVLVFPEDVGLILSFLGPRGAAARSENDALTAYARLAASYVDQTNAYHEIVPDADIGRLLLLATTDASWRAFEQTFSTLARDYGVWVVASTNVGDVAIVEDPELAATLADPDRPAGAPVYWVPDGRVWNQAFLFAPDGSIVGRARKAYLTDLENDLLDMSAAFPDDLGPLGAEAGFHFAPLISRDAWMQDAIDRVTLAGATTVLQHEAWGSVWTADVAPWSPDNIKRSGWGAVQKYPELRAAVAPMLVGNYFDMPFDGQVFAARDATPADAPLGLLAQEPDVGWAAIGPWVAPDPPGTIEERRATLAAIGAELLPGGARDDEYVEAAVWVDVDIPADDAYRPVPDAAPGAEPVLGSSVAIAPSGLGRQRHVALATDDGAVLAAWEDTRFCTGQILFARSDDGGATWSEPVRVQPWDNPQHTPAIAVLPDDTILVAWQEVLGDDRSEIRVARSGDGGQTWSRPSPVGLAGDDSDAWRPALVVDPRDAAIHLAFVDTPPGALQRRVHVSVSGDGGVTWSAPTRVDPREPGAEPVDTTYTTEWSPAMALVGDRLVVAYTHRQRPDPAEQPSHDVFVAISDDRGASFGEPVRLDLGGAPERIASDVALAAAGAGDGWLAAWTSLRGEAYDADVAIAGAPATDPPTVADTTPRRDQWFPTLAARPGGGWIVAWQDLRNGSPDVYAATIAADGTEGPPVRVDDAGASAAMAFRPRALALAADSVIVCWEDTRSGHAEIRCARGSL